MALANLANVPADPNTLAEWSFSHMDHHRQIADRIKSVYGIDVPVYPLDPVDLSQSGTSDQLYQHQEMHSAYEAVLSILGNDLTDVNWQDEAQRSDWIFLNFSSHQQAGQILGIG